MQQDPLLLVTDNKDSDCPCPHWVAAIAIQNDYTLFVTRRFRNAEGHHLQGIIAPAWLR
jgi:hypothetical protein